MEGFFPGPVLVHVPDSLAHPSDGAIPPPLFHLELGQYLPIPGENNSDEDEDDQDSSTNSKSLQIYKSGLSYCRHYTNPFLLHNAGLTLSFINVGIASYFLFAPVSYYLINTLDASPAQYSAFSTLATLPWSLKFIFGVLSDTTPILQYRRKSWLLVGWILYIFFGIYMSYQEQPSITMTTLIFFLSTCCYLLSDVCTDTLCVERGRMFESPQTKGTLQTSGYTSRAFGSIVGALMGALLFNRSQWGWGLSISQLFLLSSLIPLTLPLLPAVWNLLEIRSVGGGSQRERWGEEQVGATTSSSTSSSSSSEPEWSPPTLKETVLSLWRTLQLRAVYRPLTFIFSFYTLQIPNSAWNNFLLVGLKFTDFQIGLISVCSCLFMWAGMVVFKVFFFRTPWRRIFVYTTAISVCFSILQVLLILRINTKLGVPDFFLALGDTAAIQFTYAIQSMPSSIMFIMLCPAGNEGVTYALLTTIGNLAWTIAQDLGSGLTLIWDVRNETLAAGDFSGMLKLTLFTSLIQITPIAFVYLLPSSKSEHENLIAKQVRSFYGGAVLVAILVLGLIGSVAVNIYYIVWH